MKRILALLLSIMLVTGIVRALNTPTGFVMTSNTTAPYTAIDYTAAVFDSLNRANADSAGIINVADSTWIVVLDSVSAPSVSGTVTGLIPNTQYIWAAAADSAGEVLGISTPDTVTTTVLTFALSAGTQTNTQIAWTLTDHDTTYAASDTLAIINTSDSTIVEIISPMSTDYGTVTGLTPATTYIWAVALRNGATTIVSGLDTLTTAKVEISTESWRPRNLSMQMKKASSYQVANVDTSLFAFTAASQTDSSLVYHTATYTNLYGYVSGHADSTKITALIYAGYAGNDAIESNGLDCALVDSLNITAPGAFSFSGNIDFNGVKSHFYTVLRTDADCGYITVYPRIGRQE